MDSLETSSSRSSSRSRISIRINDKDKGVDKDKGSEILGKEILMELYDMLENVLSTTRGEREIRVNIQSDILQFPSNISKKSLSDLIFTKGMIV